MEEIKTVVTKKCEFEDGSEPVSTTECGTIGQSGLWAVQKIE